MNMHFFKPLINEVYMKRLNYLFLSAIAFASHVSATNYDLSEQEKAVVPHVSATNTDLSAQEFKLTKAIFPVEVWQKILQHALDMGSFKDCRSIALIDKKGKVAAVAYFQDRLDQLMSIPDLVLTKDLYTTMFMNASEAATSCFAKSRFPQQELAHYKTGTIGGTTWLAMFGSNSGPTNAPNSNSDETSLWRKETYSVPAGGYTPVRNQKGGYAPVQWNNMGPTVFKQYQYTTGETIQNGYYIKPVLTLIVMDEFLDLAELNLKDMQ
jgi:hypothetical protein